jgi:hypothetical protein
MIQLGMLHRETKGLVELTPGTRDVEGRLHVDRRSRPEHYLPGGASGTRGWLRELLGHASRIIRGDYVRTKSAGEPREEVFVGVGSRHEARGSKDAVSEARFLWVDIDGPDRLEVLWQFLAERPCHLLVESAGSGGVHAYWGLDRPLEARVGDREPIELANMRIVHALGEEVADANCRERGRVLRLAGTVNYKTGRYARIIDANLALPPYNLRLLVGDLPQPDSERALRRGRHRGAWPSKNDPVHRIPPPDYFRILAGVTVPPSGGVIRCLNPAHEDRHPSMRVYADPGDGFICWSCGAGGTAYDLHALLTGRPTGPKLRDEAFRQVRREVKALLRVAGDRAA